MTKFIKLAQLGPNGNRLVLIALSSHSLTEKAELTEKISKYLAEVKISMKHPNRINLREGGSGVNLFLFMNHVSLPVEFLEISFSMEASLCKTFLSFLESLGFKEIVVETRAKSAKADDARKLKSVFSKRK